ncbi:MAG TPA: NAD(+) synthase [Planctomycetota bacterium]|nr:NAD(+) synthase [Planctomycetota bacterium]
MLPPMDFGEFGFVRVAAVHPRVRIADPAGNAAEILAAAGRAAAQGVAVALFPELALSGYTCEDLFQSRDVLAAVRKALGDLARDAAGLPLTLLVGAPFQAPDGRLYDCAFVLHGGRIRGAVPKIHLPNYGEFYERRWFASGAGVDLAISDERLGEFRLSARQLFDVGRLTFAIEICEDLWAPVPPSGDHALAGAQVIFNLSASNDWVAKAEYRRRLVEQQSGRLNAAYVYVSCGPTESTKDLVFGGHALIAENGAILADGGRFAFEGALVTADLDLERIDRDRSRNMTFGTSPSTRATYAVEKLGPLPKLPSLDRRYPRTPFVPDDPATVGERAREILTLQSTGLARRLMLGGCTVPVLGLSGGLDSTLAVLVAVEAVKKLGAAPEKVQAVSMPGPGTTERTRSAAAALAARLGVTFREIPIGPAVQQHFKDIGQDPALHDVVYENSQARERTQILFDLANKLQGIVVGTGDMSELALGWCTYNGDHMASYGVNVSVPKTLVQHLVKWYADHVADPATGKVLEGILATPISPELLPPSAAGEIAQSTEAVVGPYVLHDFFLYHHLRWGAGPRKILALATLSFAGTHAPELIRRWLRVFFERFYRQQFKRTTLPPGPKVGSVSLSPRGDLRMPDEVDPEALLRDL